MFKHVLIGLSCALFAHVAVGQTELKGSPEELRNFLHPRENIVTLSAEAEKTAYSDEAIVSLVVTTKSKQLAEALQQNGELRASVRKTLTGVGVKSDNINNSKFSNSPQYSWFGKKPSSFEVVNRMAVKIDSENQLKVMAEIADQHEEIELSSTEFKHSQKDEFMQQVKQEALDKIDKQKQMYESQLNVNLVPIRFRDQPIHFKATRGAVMLEEAVVSSRAASAQSLQQSPAPEPVGTTFDEVEYRANISVDYKVISQ